MHEENVIKYYVLCNRLKDIVRTGWKNWNIERERVESIAEHIYGTQMLAIAMYSEYKYDIDIYKVILMLSIHELEEIIIGDFNPFEISKEEKEMLGHKAIIKVLSPLVEKDELKSIIFEFDEGETKEAKFAYQCDKLECDIQCKLYDEEGLVDFSKYDEYGEKYIKDKIDFTKSWSYNWINNDRRTIKYDDNFDKVAQYIIDNEIKKIGDDLL